MEFGLILGIYFILKFALTVLSSKIIILSIFSWILLVGIPFVIYSMLRYYRDRLNGGYIEFARAWNLGMLLIFFASLPEALSQFIYFEYINPTYIHDQVTQLSTALETLQNVQESPALGELINQYKETAIPAPIQMAFQGIFNNLFFGGLISLVVAAVVKRSKPAGANF